MTRRCGLSDRSELIDDLWALALRHLKELREYDRKVPELASLSGRNLEPWRALLAVALWLQDKGASRLFEKLDGLSQTYQKGRAELETPDLTSLVIQALCHCAVSAMSARR